MESRQDLGEGGDARIRGCTNLTTLSLGKEVQRRWVGPAAASLRPAVTKGIDSASRAGNGRKAMAAVIAGDRSGGRVRRPMGRGVITGAWRAGGAGDARGETSPRGLTTCCRKSFTAGRERVSFTFF